MRRVRHAVDHVLCHSWPAHSCPAGDNHLAQEEVQARGYRVLTPLVSLETPGKATVQVCGLAAGAGGRSGKVQAPCCAHLSGGYSGPHCEFTFLHCFHMQVVILADPDGHEVRDSKWAANARLSFLHAHSFW